MRVGEASAREGGMEVGGAGDAGSTAEEQEKWLADAIALVQHNAFYMHRALVINPSHEFSSGLWVFVCSPQLQPLAEIGFGGGGLDRHFWARSLDLYAIRIAVSLYGSMQNYSSSVSLSMIEAYRITHFVT